MTSPSPARAAQLRDQGIQALRAGRRGEAQEWLAQSVELNPQDEQAWLWLSGAADSAEDQRFCLQRALALNPQNAAARRGLEQLGPEPAPPPAPEPPAAWHQPATGPTIALQPAPETSYAVAAPAPQTQSAAIFAPTTEFSFPSLAEWKSIWYGPVVVGGSGMIYVGRRLQLPALYWLGLLILLAGGALYAFGYLRGLVKPGKDGYMAYDSNKSFGRDHQIMGERTNPLALKAGQRVRVSYQSQLRGGHPVLRLIRQDRLGRDLGLVWELPLAADSPAPPALTIGEDGMHVVELLPQGARGAVEIRWTLG